MGRFLEDERRPGKFYMDNSNCPCAFVLISLLALFFNDFLVKYLIIEEVRKQIGLGEGQSIPKMPQEITKEEFVTVTGKSVKSFATNHKIPESYMLTLEKGEFLTSDSLKKDETFKNVQTKVTKIQKDIQDLKAINAAFAHGFFTATVYDNNHAPDNVILLNKRNAVIDHYLRQNHCYKMAPHSSGNEKKQAYRVDVGDYTDPDDKEASVGSMNYITKSKLLAGSKGNMVKIYIKEKSCP